MPRNLSWTSGLMTCSPTSNEMAERGTGHDPQEHPLESTEDQADKQHGADDRGREEVGELAPAIDGRGTFEHAKCVQLQAVRAVTA